MHASGAEKCLLAFVGSFSAAYFPILSLSSGVYSLYLPHLPFRSSCSTCTYIASTEVFIWTFLWVKKHPVGGLVGRTGCSLEKNQYIDTVASFPGYSVRTSGVHIKCVPHLPSGESLGTRPWWIAKFVLCRFSSILPNIL